MKDDKFVTMPKINDGLKMDWLTVALHVSWDKVLSMENFLSMSVPCGMCFISYVIYICLTVNNIGVTITTLTLSF